MSLVSTWHTKHGTGPSPSSIIWSVTNIGLPVIVGLNVFITTPYAVLYLPDLLS